MAKSTKNKLSKEEIEELIKTLKTRFDKHMHRHKGLQWEKVYEKLKTDPAKLWSLSEMERTGGEPDVTGFDKKSNSFVFTDCSSETPKGRRSLCYDREALDARKEFKPANNVIDMAKEMGIELLTEEEYRALQSLEAFDTKTSSWLKTPAEIRKLGGAIFGDHRYGQVFIYHNGAQSYYNSRAFRGSIKV